MGFNICGNDGFSWIDGKIQNYSQVDTEIRLSPAHGIGNIFYHDYFAGGRSSDCWLRTSLAGGAVFGTILILKGIFVPIFNLNLKEAEKMR